MHGKATRTLRAPGAARKSGASATYVPRTELGRRLWQIRQKILASGQPLLDWEGLEMELRARRGEPGEEA
jgi:hypothetical protein